MTHVCSDVRSAVPCEMRVTYRYCTIGTLYGTCISTNVYISSMSNTFILSVLGKVYSSLYSSIFVV